MASGFYNVPKAVNEPVKSYAPGSFERKTLIETYKKMFNEQVDIPFYIGGKDLYSQFSKVMITCSKSLRSIATNFVYKV